MKRIKTLLFRLFWVDRFNEAIARGKPAKFLRFYAYFAMGAYVFSLLSMLVGLLVNFDIGLLIGLPLGLIVFPLLYRAVIGILAWVTGV